MVPRANKSKIICIAFSRNEWQCILIYIKKFPQLTLNQRIAVSQITKLSISISDFKNALLILTALGLVVWDFPNQFGINLKMMTKKKPNTKF